MRSEQRTTLICYMSKTLVGHCDIFYKQDQSLFYERGVLLRNGVQPAEWTVFTWNRTTLIHDQN